jgi:hypothetical protein
MRSTTWLVAALGLGTRSFRIGSPTHPAAIGAVEAWGTEGLACDCVACRVGRRSVALAVFVGCARTTSSCRNRSTARESVMGTCCGLPRFGSSVSVGVIA